MKKIHRSRSKVGIKNIVEKNLHDFNEVFCSVQDKIAVLQLDLMGMSRNNAPDLGDARPT